MIQARGIQKHFGPLQVLKGIDLDIVPGHVTAIVGPNGAGKTTLLQILGTLSVPDSGTVTYDSDNPFTLSDRRLSEFRNRRIGFVFQQHRLLPEFNLLENVAMPALISGNSRREAFEKARTLIKRLGLGHRLEHRPAELSGGEWQRASVARGLINSPQVILADEPSGSLDSQNKNELHRLFFELRDEIGATFVIVTHDETLASDCNHVIHMLDGRIDRVSHNS